MQDKQNPTQSKDAVLANVAKQYQMATALLDEEDDPEIVAYLARLKAVLDAAEEAAP